MTDRVTRAETYVEIAPEAAFAIFTAGLGRWWPLAFTFSGPDTAGALLDERGWSEVDSQGAETSWGRTRVWEPPARIVVSFAISPDRRPAPPDQASEVEIRFEPRSAGARIVVEHRDFDRHGEGGEALREGMASAQGWPLILAEFAREIRQSGR